MLCINNLKCSSLNRMQMLLNKTRVSEEAADTTLFGICEMESLHILNSVHQSGVNCLYVSDTKDLSIAKGRSTHYVLSGGDDQALNCLRFDISWKETSYIDQDLKGNGCDTSSLEGTNDSIHACGTQKYAMRFLLLDKIKSAHASAVKELLLFLLVLYLQEYHHFMQVG